MIVNNMLMRVLRRILSYPFFIAAGNKVPGDPPEALASWKGGVQII